MGKSLGLGVAVGWWLGLAGMAAACVIIPPRPPRPEIRPLYLQVKSQHVETSITDQVARVTVTTVLHNPHASRVEGTFLYPLPPDAAVSDFSYWMDGKEMRGELLDRDQARRLYEDIVRTMRDPALLEYDGGGAFKASIFPVTPHGEVKTRLQFTQVLTSDGGVVKYCHAVKLGRTTPSQGDLVLEVGIKSQVPIKAVYSPTHAVDVVRQSEHAVSVSVEVDQTDFSTDFALYYTLTEQDFGLHVLPHRQEGAPGYFLLLLSPKRDWGEREIVGKDVVFALDTSGSMSGQKIEQAQAALKQCLQALRPEDRFGLLTFATATRLLEDKLLEVNERSIRRAVEHVGKLQAAGSTALDDALAQSVELIGKRSARPTMVLFLTDGLPTQGERDPEAILQHVSRANQTTKDDEPDQRVARLFIFGVGHDVNTHLLDKIADASGGATTYVRPGEDVEAAISQLYAKLSHPVLSEVKLEMAGMEAHDLYPSHLPDLFVGSQLVVAGRYEGSGPAAVTLSGLAAGERRCYRYEAELPAIREGNAFVARVWAGRRVGYLLDEIRLHGEAKEIKDEIVRLAVQFGIVTPYTSYLVQEDGKLSQRLGGRVAQSRAFRESADALGRGGGFSGAAPAMPTTPGGAPLDARRAMAGPVGAWAVHAAQSQQALKNAAQTTQGDQSTYRSVGERTFYFDGEWWLDAAWDANLTIVPVKAFSSAYFELLKLRPELSQYLALGAQVKVRLGPVGLVVGGEGVEALDATQRTQVRQ